MPSWGEEATGMLVYRKLNIESTNELIRGTIVNRTYGIHKNLYIQTIFTNNSWPY